jgi:hypothetical protein
MANILYPPSRPQSVGEILDSAFRIFGATLPKCLPYAALAVIAGQLPTLYDLSHGRPLLQAVLTQRIHDPLWWALYVVAIVGTMTLTNAVILRQYGLATGRAAAAGAELATGARKIPGMLLIAIVLGLAVVGCLLPAGIVGGMAAGFSGGVPQAAVALTLFVLLALIPASWLLVRWSCSGTVYLLMDRTAVESLSHSWRLTAGNFWRLSLVYTVGVVLLLVLYALSTVLGGVMALVLARGDVAVITAATTVVVVLLGAVATPFYWALALAVLGDLSARREGTDLAQRMSAPATQ